MYFPDYLICNYNDERKNRKAILAFTLLNILISSGGIILGNNLKEKNNEITNYTKEKEPMESYK